MLKVKGFVARARLQVSSAISEETHTTREDVAVEGFVTGHGFSRAVTGERRMGL
jgi:hypothetical protein